MRWFDTVNMNVMERSLGALWTRQAAIADNIANVDTPGYKARFVTFESQLKNELARLKNQGYTPSSYNVPLKSEAASYTDVRTSERVDGNNVDITAEMIESARTTMQMNYMVRKINDEFSRLSTAISGSR